MKLLRHFPNALTCGNLLCGAWGIYLALAEQDLFAAVGAMLLGALLDVFDGAAARALKVAGGIGKDLDSLADVVSFGALPAFLGLQMFIEGGAIATSIWFALAPAAIVMCAALRLAKFNNDPGQATYFIGLPTPAAALGLAGLAVQWANDDPLARHPATGMGWVALYLVAIAVLMVSRLPLISFKLGLRATWAYWLAIVGVAAASLPWAQGLCSLVGIGGYVVASQLYFSRAKSAARS